MEIAQAEIMAQLEQDYNRARERGMFHPQTRGCYSPPSQRMAKMIGASPTPTT